MDKDWTDGTIDMGPCGVMPVCAYRGTPSRNAPLVLHLHGGAFQGGTLADGHFLARLIADAGAVVVSPDYPVGQAFPAALEGLFALLLRLHEARAHWAGRASRLFVAGVEAGGNLAAGLALMARDRRAPPLAGQILFSPMLDPAMATCSLRDAAAGPVGCKWADGWRAYLGTSGAEPHPYAAPAGASRLAGVAPALVLTAEDDPMHDESLRYFERLRGGGIAVHCHSLPGPSHWPDALSHPALPEPAWREPVRARIAGFLADPTAE